MFLRVDGKVVFLRLETQIGHSMDSLRFQRKRVDRLRHGLTTRFFYVFQAVLNVFSIFFLSYYQFDGEIHVIQFSAIESISQFNQFNIPVFGLDAIFDVNVSVVSVKRFREFDDFG